MANPVFCVSLIQRAIFDRYQNEIVNPFPKEIEMAKSGQDEGQLKSEDSAPDFVRVKPAPEFVKDSYAPNTLDPARGGNQKGDGAKE